MAGFGKKRVGAGQPPSGAAAPLRVVPLASNFDFLEGAFTRAEKTRRSSLAATALALVVLSAMVLLGFTASSTARTNEAAEQTARVADAAAVAEIAKLDQSEGIPAAALRAHALARQTALKVALKNEPDVAGLVQQVTASLPGGMSLTSLELNAASGAAGAPAASTSTGSAPAGTSGGASPSATTLTVAATADSFAKIGQWRTAMAAIPGLVLDAQPEWSGGTGDAGIQVTMKATVGAAASSARAQKLAGSDPYGLPKEGR